MCYCLAPSYGLNWLLWDPLTPWFILKSKMLVLTVSKLFLMSTNTPQAKLSLSQASWMLPPISRSALFVGILINKTYSSWNRRERVFQENYSPLEANFSISLLRFEIRNIAA